jgi:hypothetical protein
MTASPSDEQTYEGSGRISVAIWSTARSGPQHRIRLTEQAESDEIELVLGRALAAHQQLAAELAKPQLPFEGEEPRAA